MVGGMDAHRIGGCDVGRRVLLVHQEGNLLKGEGVVDSQVYLRGKGALLSWCGDGEVYGVATFPSFHVDGLVVTVDSMAAATDKCQCSRDGPQYAIPCFQESCH